MTAIASVLILLAAPGVVVLAGKDARQRIDAAAVSGEEVQLGPGIFRLDGPLDGTRDDVRISGVSGRTTLQRVRGGTSAGILHPDRGRYRGWTVRGVTVDGEADLLRDAGLPGATITLVQAERVLFEDCTFIDMVGSAGLYGCHDIEFRRCVFLGAKPGVMRGGTWDPPANPAAVYGSGVVVADGSADVRFERCDFVLCQSGIHQAGQPGKPIRGMVVDRCRFLARWWDGPYVVAAGEVAGYDRASRVVTILWRGEPVAFDGLSAVTLCQIMAQGDRFKRVYGFEVGAGTDLATVVLPGDVIETSDGRRTRVQATGVQAITVGPWQSIADHGPVDPPFLETPWRLVRSWSAVGFAVQGDDGRVVPGRTQLYFEPACPETGERLGIDVGLSPMGWTVRVQAPGGYSGLHAGDGQDGPTVTQCEFVGAQYDQCSIFDSVGASVSGCRFRAGQDEAVTATRCPQVRVVLNDFVLSGVSAIFLGDSHRAVFANNTIRDWGITNPHPGAIDGAAEGAVIASNTVIVDSGASSYAVNLFGPSDGTVISGLTGTGRQGTVWLDADSGHVTVRDAGTIVGPGATNP